MKFITLCFIALPIFIVVVPYVVNIVTQYPGQATHTNGVVLVTGASSGIGLSAAVALQKQGFTVIGGVRKEKDAQTLHKKYNLRSIILDVTKEVEIESAKQQLEHICAETNLKFVGLINNAGVSLDLPVELQPRKAKVNSGNSILAPSCAPLSFILIFNHFLIPLLTEFGPKKAPR